MKSLGVFYLFLMILSCSGHEPKKGQQPDLHFIEIHPNKLSFLTKQNILQLAQVYDLEPFLFSKKVIILSRDAHGSKDLSISTKNAEKPHQLLSDILHEEFHWLLNSNESGRRKSVQILRKKFPKFNLQTGTEALVCFLEYQSLKHLLGTKEANRITSRKKSSLYGFGKANANTLKNILKDNNLLPGPLL